MPSKKVIGVDEDLSAIDKVVFAVAPIDSLTGRIVSRNISAHITVQGENGKFLRLHNRPIRNLSGLLVFVNLDDHPQYRVHVNAKDAGYFDPEPKEFVALKPGEKPKPNEWFDRLRIDFPLFPRPEFRVDEKTTFVSGVVIRSKQKVEGARIVITVPSSQFGGLDVRSDQEFETRTNHLGAFILALRLPASFDISDGDQNSAENPIHINIKVETRDGDDEWKLEMNESNLEVFDKRRHTFNKPIDLTGQDQTINLITI